MAANPDGRPRRVSNTLIYNINVERGRVLHLHINVGSQANDQHIVINVNQRNEANINRVDNQLSRNQHQHSRRVEYRDTSHSHNRSRSRSPSRHSSRSSFTSNFRGHEYSTYRSRSRSLHNSNSRTHRGSNRYRDGSGEESGRRGGGVNRNNRDGRGENEGRGEVRNSTRHRLPDWEESESDSYM